MYTQKVDGSTDASPKGSMKTRLRNALALLLGLCAGLAGAATVEGRASQIRIRSIDVEEASPREVFEFLREQSKAADPEGKGLNFIYRFTPAGRKIFDGGAVTVKLNDVPLSAVVHDVCLATGLLYSYDENALLVFDAATPQQQPMVTKVYRVGAGVVDSPRTRPKARSLERDSSSGR